jgi:hypothetical protein
VTIQETLWLFFGGVVGVAVTYAVACAFIHVPKTRVEPRWRETRGRY